MSNHGMFSRWCDFILFLTNVYNVFLLSLWPYVDRKEWTYIFYNVLLRPRGKVKMSKVARLIKRNIRLILHFSDLFIFRHVFNHWQAVLCIAVQRPKRKLRRPVLTSARWPMVTKTKLSLIWYEFNKEHKCFPKRAIQIIREILGAYF